MTSEDPTKVCPFCGESIKQVATVCRYCHSKLDGSQPIDAEQPGSPAPTVASSKSISLKRIAVALVVLLSVGGAAGYWYLRKNPSCADGVGTVHEILLENILKPFSSSQRAGIQKAISITINDVSQRSQSEEGRLCSATVALASKNPEFSRFTDLNTTSTNVLKLLPQWDVVAHKMEAPVEFNIKRDGDNLVVSARGPALFIPEPLLQAASEWDAINQAALYFNRLTQEAQRSEKERLGRLNQEAQRLEIERLSRLTPDAQADPKNDAPQAREQTDLTTPYGAISISEDKVLLVNGKPTIPVVEGDFSLSVKQHTVFQSGYALLIMNISGGTACPAQYRWVLLEASGPKVTPEFGTCSDLVQVTQANNSLMVTMPNMADGRSVLYAFDGSTVFEDGKALKQQ